MFPSPYAASGHGRVAPRAAGDRGPPRAPLVEDDPVDARVMTEALRALGLLVVRAPGLARATALPHEAAVGLALVVLDLGLPGSWPAATPHAVERVAARTPVVVVSGAAGELDALGRLRGRGVRLLDKDELEGLVAPRSSARRLVASSPVREVGAGPELPPGIAGRATGRAHAWVEGTGPRPGPGTFSGGSPPVFHLFLRTRSPRLPREPVDPHLRRRRPARDGIELADGRVGCGWGPTARPGTRATTTGALGSPWRRLGT